MIGFLLDQTGEIWNLRSLLRFPIVWCFLNGRKTMAGSRWVTIMCTVEQERTVNGYLTTWQTSILTLSEA